MWRGCCLIVLLAGCSSVPADSAALANRNLYLVPNNSPAQGQVAPNAPMMVVCGTNDPRNYQQNLGWGGETTPRCWYGRPATVQIPYAQPVPPPTQ
jgi:hypothetical protein